MCYQNCNGCHNFSGHCSLTNPNAINDQGCPQYWMDNPGAQAQIDAANNVTNTSNNSNVPLPKFKINVNTIILISLGVIGIILALIPLKKQKNGK